MKMCDLWLEPWFSEVAPLKSRLKYVSMLEGLFSDVSNELWFCVFSSQDFDQHVSLLTSVCNVTKIWAVYVFGYQLYVDHGTCLRGNSLSKTYNS